jgi:3-oxoacyl-[acyl-carrier protein] reductase
MEYALRERVILILGSLSTTVQSLMSGLTNAGADVALLDPEANVAERFCNQLSDQREINPKHGRAMAVKTETSSYKDIKEAVGRVAQTFGGVDVLIDARMENNPTPLTLDSLEVDFDQHINKNLRTSLLATQAVAGFLKSRKKGRIIYLINDSILRNDPSDSIQAATRMGLVGFSQSLAKQIIQHNVTVNVVSIGLTEEYLLAHDPGKTIKEALEKQRIADPSARITEPDKITNALVFLLGPSGAAVTGQVLRLS